MKIKISLVAFLCLLSLSIVTSSCDDIFPDDPKGEITIDGTSYDIYYGNLIHIQDIDTLQGCHNLILDFSSIVDPAAIDAIHAIVSSPDSVEAILDSLAAGNPDEHTTLLLNIYTSTNNSLDATTYNFESFDAPLHNIHTFNGAWVHQVQTIGNSTYGILNTGNITVGVNGNEYTITFTFTDEQGRNISGNYTGQLSYISTSLN